MRGQERRLRRLLGPIYAWPDRLGLLAINRRMSPGPTLKRPLAWGRGSVLSLGNYLLTPSVTE